MKNKISSIIIDKKLGRVRKRGYKESNFTCNPLILTNLKEANMRAEQFQFSNLILNKNWNWEIKQIFALIKPVIQIKLK